MLTFISLFDAFVTKPEADRISRLTQFNQAVNSAAKTRQEVIQAQIQMTDPALQLAIASGSTPRILNDISTAKALMRDLNNRDVGIPQLIVLITEAFTAGDLESARSFVDRAVNKADVSALMHSEALRYQGKLWFSTGNPVQGRQSLQAAVATLGDAPGAAMQRAFVQADLVMMDFASRYCDAAAEDLKAFQGIVRLPQVSVQAASQLATTVRAQFAQLQGQGCPVPADFSAR